MARKTKQVVVTEPELEPTEAGGLGIDEGIVLGTFLLLVGAIVLVLIANKAYELPLMLPS